MTDLADRFGIPILDANKGVEDTRSAAFKCAKESNGFIIDIGDEIQPSFFDQMGGPEFLDVIVTNNCELPPQILDKFAGNRHKIVRINGGEEAVKKVLRNIRIINRQARREIQRLRDEIDQKRSANMDSRVKISDFKRFATESYSTKKYRRRRLSIQDGRALRPNMNQGLTGIPKWENLSK